MGTPGPPTTCADCGGKGYIGEDICSVCIGQGSLPLKGISKYLKTRLDDIEEKISDTKEKCDEIKSLMDEHPWW